MNFGVLWMLGNVLLVIGVSGVGTDQESVFVKEGDSVTLHTNTEANQQGKMMWYFNDTLIAKIIGEKREICSEDECKERFRDRLKLDQTGSLTITNIRTTDSGDYTLKIINTGSDSDKIFSVSVHDVSAAERDEMKRKSVKEGESVTLDPGVVKNPNVVMMWYFNDTLIAKIIGEKREICSYDECKERFRDRLKLNNQTGSLTIMNITNTVSGDYKLLITSNSFSISRILTVLTVNAVPDSGLYSVAVAGIGVLLLIISAAAAVFLCHRARRKDTRKKRDQGIELKDVPRDQSMTPCIPPEVNAMRPIMEIM